MAASSSSARAGNQALHVDQRCELTSYGRGRIAFVGQTSFSPGVWVGVVLDEAIGKHDGVVQGKRYFTAHAGHGIFVRSSQVHALDIDEHDSDPEEEEGDAGDAPPSLPPARTAVSRASVASSSARTSSPVKPNVIRSGRTSALPGPAARPGQTTAGVRGPFAAARPSAASPEKRAAAAGTPTSRISPFKTPAARPSTGPRSSSAAAGLVPRTSMAAAGTRTSTASPAKGVAVDRSASQASTRTPATLAAKSRVSGMGVAGGTPSTAAARTPASSLAQARLAVQAGRAPDTATARAGLRPVAKTRASMAPPSAATPTSYPRTPAATSTAAGRIAAGVRTAQPTVTRRTPVTGISATPRTAKATTPGTGVRSGLSSASRIGATGASTSSSARSSQQPTLDGEEEEEDLLAMSIDDEEDAALPIGEPLSPSLRQAAKQAAPDHMSLTRGPASSTNLARTATTADLSGLHRELEELRAKLRIAEKRREEDRELIRESERIQQESEQFLAVKPKMTAKQQELQDQLKDLRRLEREWLTQKEESERQLAELNDQLELLSLDKEMAEERAESALEELQALKDRVEELELDVDVLREENARYESGPVEDEEKLSVGYIQMEKQNERLKEALIRLRDMTAESDADQKHRISELEKELRALDELQASYESVTAKLAQSDALLEDLKIQLDDALGAEEMMEQLTERNLMLTEKLDEMRVVIEELEALKDLNDELEETHIETENQLQEELDLKEMQIREYRLRTESLEANIVDYEGTFAQFRELVLNLQSENETLRNDEKARDASRTAAGADDQAMLNLNLKLQSSTLKSQAKTIELEMGKLDAAQAKEQLEMVHAYLPKVFVEHDKDAVQSILFFQRVASKTEILKNIIEGNNDIASSLSGIVNERLIAVCQMRHSLAHFIASSRQIYALIRLASIPTFLKAGRMFKELATIERRIDQFVELLRREELKEDECAQDFRRFVKMLEDFEVALLEGSAGEALDSDLAAKELGSAILFELDLDTISAALGFSKQTVAALYNDYLAQTAASAAANAEDDTENAKTPAEDAIDMQMGDLNIDEAFFTPLQDLINHIRSTKVPARKMMRRLLSIYNNDEAVKMDAIIQLPGLGKLSSQLVTFASTLASSFAAHVHNVRTNKAPFELKGILSTVEETARDVLGTDDAKLSAHAGVAVGRGADAWKVTLGETAQLGATVSDLLNAAMENENVRKVSGTFPWLGRVDELRLEQENNVESQRLVAKQAEDLRDLFKQIKARDELIEENRIKIERLSKQLQRSKKDNETVTPLRDELLETTKRMKAYEENNSELQRELEQLQGEYERLLNEGDAARAKGSLAEASGSGAGGAQASESTGGATARSLEAGQGAGNAGNSGSHSAYVGTVSSILPSSNYETSYLVDQVEGLRGAVKYLRLENSLLKGRDLLSQVELLPALGHRLSREDSGVGLDDRDAQQKADEESAAARGLPRSKKEGRKTGKGLATGIGLGTSSVRDDRAEPRKVAGGKRLAQEWMRMVSNPRVVTLRTAPSSPHEAQDGSANPVRKRTWVPMAQLPEVQYRDQLQQRARLLQRIEALQSGGSRETVGGGLRGLGAMSAYPTNVALRT